VAAAHHVPRELRLLPFRGSDVIAAGLTWSQLRGSGWRRLLPDVYVAADVEMDHRLWCYAAITYARSAPGVVISGLSAVALWGVGALPFERAPVELTVPPGLRIASRLPFVRVVCSLLPAGDVVTFGGPPVTSPTRTAFDVACRLPCTDAVASIDALLHRRVVTPDALAAFASSVAGRRGSVRFATALDLAEPLAESPMESRLCVGLVDQGLPRPEAQVEVRDERGRLIARLDLAYRKQKVGIEYDGDHHRERSTFRADVRRLNALAAAGYRVVRVTGADIPHNLPQIADQVRQLLDQPPP
jgi:hypothetical protein